MNERDRNLQHTMLSFAYMGGMLVKPERAERRSPGLLSSFIPFLKKTRD